MYLRLILMKAMIHMKNKFSLHDICSVSNGFEDDRFVGIKLSSGKPEVHFPIGFSISSSNDELREDIVTLIKVLKRFFYSEINNNLKQSGNVNENRFPLLAYQRILLRYLNYGQYFETETEYTAFPSGKIDWSRTIKKNIPSFSEQGAVYLETTSKKSKLKSESLISKIFDYCVYYAFQNIGWLYTNKKFPIPEIKFNKQLFLSAVSEKLNTENNDSRKELFSDMLEIISDQSNRGVTTADRLYGTFEFEYVWEKIIDCAFGELNKKIYFPHTYWKIEKDGTQTVNHALEPDTIMKAFGNAYVIDAKYYRYGSSNNSNNLPASSSIHKQITYGEYIANNPNFQFGKVYNAFLLPADLQSNTNKSDGFFSCFGVAVSDWKDGSNPYETVAGIFADTKGLMKCYSEKKRLSKELALLISSQIV